MTTWVFSEEVDGQPSGPSLEVLTKAASMGDTAVVYLGSGGNDAFAAIGAHGGDVVYHLTGEGGLPAAAAAAALADLVSSHSPDAVLFAQTYTSRDVAGRLAARIDRPVLSNAVDVSFEGGCTVTSEVFGGTQIVETALTDDGPYLVLVRPKSFVAEENGGGAPSVETVVLPEVGHSGSPQVVDTIVEKAEGPALPEAAIIVSGGRGLGAAEAYQLIEDVAAPLGAATGATRAIVDAGWVPYAKQVGQTGKTVKPDVYLACGVSGAMQHLVGMKDAKIIIAINKDSEAPIFSVADLGVVGDVHKVLPKLADALNARS